MEPLSSYRVFWRVSICERTSMRALRLSFVEASLLFKNRPSDEPTRFICLGASASSPRPLKRQETSPLRPSFKAVDNPIGAGGRVPVPSQRIEPDLDASKLPNGAELPLAALPSWNWREQSAEIAVDTSGLLPATCGDSVLLRWCLLCRCRLLGDASRIGDPSPKALMEAERLIGPSSARGIRGRSPLRGPVAFCWRTGEFCEEVRSGLGIGDCPRLREAALMALQQCVPQPGPRLLPARLQWPKGQRALGLGPPARLG